MRSFRQYITEGGMSTVSGGAATHDELSGGEGAMNPGNQFAYFTDPNLMGGRAGSMTDYDPRLLASAEARRRAMERQFGSAITRGATKRAETSIGSDTGWAPVNHASGRQRAEDDGWNDNWYTDYKTGGRGSAGRSAYNDTLNRMNQAYENQTNPRQAISKGGKGAGYTTSDNRRKGR